MAMNYVMKNTLAYLKHDEIKESHFRFMPIDPG